MAQAFFIAQREEYKPVIPTYKYKDKYNKNASSKVSVANIVERETFTYTNFERLKPYTRKSNNQDMIIIDNNKVQEKVCGITIVYTCLLQIYQQSV